MSRALHATVRHATPSDAPIVEDILNGTIGSMEGDDDILARRLHLDVSRQSRPADAPHFAHPLKSRILAYCVGGTPCMHVVVLTVLRVPSGTCPPPQVSVVHCV